jgi:hypothetical protein
MQKCSGRFGQAKTDFKDAQKIIKIEETRLNEYGFSSVGLLLLMDMRCSKPRDEVPSSVTDIDIMRLIEINK